MTLSETVIPGLLPEHIHPGVSVGYLLAVICSIEVKAQEHYLHR
jgi:hypothetical protein